MALGCPSRPLGDALAQGLIGEVDCQVQGLVRGGYDALFSPGGALGDVLSALLVVYVALIGYRLLFGRGELDVSSFVLSGIKLAAVLALATQWSAYEALVFRLAFEGPADLGRLVLTGASQNGAPHPAEVFAGLDRAIADLSAFSPAAPPGAVAPAPSPPSPVLQGTTPSGAGAVSTLLSRAGFDAALLLGSAVALMISTLGVLLAAKIVLGLLLALGPVFIALFLFEETRSLFEGWLRALLAFAFAPLAVTLTLALALVLLAPELTQLELMRAGGPYVPGTAFAVAALTGVTVLVSLGLVLAGALAFGAVRLPRGGRARAPSAGGEVEREARAEPAERPRAARLGVAVEALAARGGRRVYVPAASEPALGPGEARILLSAPRPTGAGEVAITRRLGQSARGAGPRRGRAVRRQEEGRRV